VHQRDDIVLLVEHGYDDSQVDGSIHAVGP
jgi:hypothetical protein